MQVICKKCGKILKSLLIDQKQAIAEIASKTQRHLQHSHLQIVRDEFVPIMAQLNVGLSSYLSIQRYYDIPEDEFALLEAIEEDGEKLSTLIFGENEEEGEEEMETASEQLEELIRLAELMDRLEKRLGPEDEDYKALIEILGKEDLEEALEEAKEAMKEGGIGEENPIPEGALTLTARPAKLQGIETGRVISITPGASGEGERGPLEGA